ncbi:MAG: hypothetical protein AAF204_00130 [Pseudomonadota bacterium]
MDKKKIENFKDLANQYFLSDVKEREALGSELDMLEAELSADERFEAYHALGLISDEDIKALELAGMSKAEILDHIDEFLETFNVVLDKCINTLDRTHEKISDMKKLMDSLLADAKARNAFMDHEDDPLGHSAPEVTQ